MKIMTQDPACYKEDKFKDILCIGIVREQNIDFAMLTINHYQYQELEEAADQAPETNIGISAEILIIIISLNVCSCVKLMMILSLLIITKMNMVFSIQIIPYLQFYPNLNLLSI